MAGSPDDVPAGDREREGQSAQDADRLMRGLRDARVRAMIARGEAPVGFRINDDRTGFVQVGNPAWPVRPLDPHCTQFSEPSLELAVLIRKVLPDFDPEKDRRGWLEVAELVLRTGRPAAEVQAMTHDELVAFFRHEAFHLRPGGPVDGNFGRREGAKPAPTEGISMTTRAADQGAESEKSTSEILREWLGDPARKQRLVATLSSERAGELIGRSATSVREAGDAWKELKAEFKTYRAFRRYERERRK